MQSLSFNPQLLAKSVEEVAEKLRATSRANEDVIQTVANQRVASAYEYALRYRFDNPECCRDTLISVLTSCGVSHETAAGIVDSSIIKNADAG